MSTLSLFYAPSSVRILCSVCVCVCMLSRPLVHSPLRDSLLVILSVRRVCFCPPPRALRARIYRSSAKRRKEKGVGRGVCKAGIGHSGGGRKAVLKAACSIHQPTFYT